MFRKLAISVVVLILLASSLTVVWSALNLVPIRFVWRYGLTPGCEPTGKVIKVQDIEFVVIGPGCFRMGSNALGKPGNLFGRLCRPIGADWGRAVEPSNEMPVHYVEFPDGFAMARTEVTNAQYSRYLDANPQAGRPADWGTPYHSAPRQPVVGVGWNEARSYCAWLSKKAGLHVRLPTESEWECACRAGTETEYESGDDVKGQGAYAWCGQKARTGKTHEVGNKKPNAWGLFDLAGNAWEWCEDRWHDSYLLTLPFKGKDGSARTLIAGSAPVGDSPWDRGGSLLRVMRGGSWANPAEFGRSAFRDGFAPSVRSLVFGFRPALTLLPCW